MDFEAARIKMVDNQIRTTDVTDVRILRAFLKVPREEFVPEERRPLAFIDEDVPLGRGRFLMEPSPFAKLLQLADIQPDETVLVVGCATGYSAAVLSHLARSVVALESDADFVTAATQALTALGCGNASVVEGTLAEGHRKAAPYDVILFEGAVEAIPAVFFEQLRDGGRLIAVEGKGNAAFARLHVKDGGTLSRRFGFNCSVKPLPGFAKAAEFVF